MKKTRCHRPLMLKVRAAEELIENFFTGHQLKLVANIGKPAEAGLGLGLSCEEKTGDLPWRECWQLSLSCYPPPCQPLPSSPRLIRGRISCSAWPMTGPGRM